jgi:alpha-L-arabinofuranosidase
VVLPVANNAAVQEILPAGRIGVGTTKSSAEFKEVKVTHGDKVLLASDFVKDANGWTNDGRWHVVGGVYQQNDTATAAMSLAGDKTWTDYTLTLKARKTGGTDGFVVTVFDDGAGAYAQWILGGWANTQHGILTHYAEQDQLGERVAGVIETNRWYDVKVVVKRAQMECYLDGKLVQSAEVLKHRVPGLFTSATRVQKSDEIILKVVNPADRAVEGAIQLQCAKDVSGTGTATVMSAALAEENTFEKPGNVVPVTRNVRGVSRQFKYMFAPRSVTVLRLSLRNDIGANVF